MTAAVALIEEVNPESHALEQLALTGESFDAVRGLAAAGMMTVTGLDLADADLTYDEYESVGLWIGTFNRACSWWIGDWLVYGEGAFPERYSQAQEITGLSKQTLLNRVYVCRNIPPSRRKPMLAFSTHSEVASLDAREQKMWLDKAAANGWSHKDLRAARKALRKDEHPDAGSGDDVDAETLHEVALAILRDARQADDGQHHLVPNEDIARLRAAMGEEE